MPDFTRRALPGATVSVLAFAASAALLATLVGVLQGRPPPRDPPAQPPAPIVIPKPRAPLAGLQLVGTSIDTGERQSATLTVRVGSRTLTSSVTLPDYTVSLPASNAADMVSIELTSADLKYTSILGSYRQLTQRAGGDARLTVDELDRLRLSPMSTALAFHVQFDLGGRLPASDIEHEQTLRYFDALGAMDAAFVLHRFAIGQLSLPAGYATGYALLADRTAYRNFRETDADALSSSRDDYLRTVASVALPSTDIGKAVLLSFPLARGKPQLIVNWADVLLATPAGYELNTRLGRRNAGNAASLVDGDLRLVPQYETYTTQTAYDDTGVSHLERRDVIDTTLRRVFAGSGVTLWLEVQQDLVTRLDDPSYPPAIAYTIAALSGVSLDRPALRRASPDLVGQRALPVFCKQGDQGLLAPCEYALHRSAADGGGRTENVGNKVDSNMQPIGALGGETYRWEGRPAGGFRISYPQSDVTYWTLNEGDQATDTLVYVARRQEGSDVLTVSGITAMIRADGTDGFDELPAAGTWRYGSFEQGLARTQYGTTGIIGTDTFSRDPDGTAIQRFRVADPLHTDFVGFNYYSGWSVLDGRLYDTRYRAGQLQTLRYCYESASCIGFSNCESAYALGATECAPLRVRYFRPLARVGKRLYGIEDLYDRSSEIPFSYTAPFTFQRFSRANYYDKE